MSNGSDSPELAHGVGWHPAPPPAVFPIHTALEAVPFITGWNRALSRAAEVKVRQLGVTDSPTRVVSVSIAGQPLRVRSFSFREPEEKGDRFAWSAEAARSREPPREKAKLSPSLHGSTRIRPPGDVIKLVDRLRYVLQPSLESLLAERSLEFPLGPFAYQLEGIAFLYPRHAAILADEMGLGKTMQAVTAIRLLVRS